MTDAIIRLDGPTAEGSIIHAAKQRNTRPENLIVQTSVCVLFDNSSSMSDRDAPEGMSRYEYALEQLKVQQAAHPGQILIVEFNSIVSCCLTGIPGEPGGATHLVPAMGYVREYFDGPGKKVILITDGMPNGPATFTAMPESEAGLSTLFTRSTDVKAACITRSSELESQLTAIYCGPQGNGGTVEQEATGFLVELVKANGKQGKILSRPGAHGLDEALDKAMKLLPPPPAA